MMNGKKGDTALDMLRQAKQILTKSNNDNLKKASNYLDEAIRLIHKPEMA